VARAARSGLRPSAVAPVGDERAPECSLPAGQDALRIRAAGVRGPTTEVRPGAARAGFWFRYVWSTFPVGWLVVPRMCR
jgi:hypothetical protein